MKNKLLKLIVICIMFMPFVVLADSGQLRISCNASTLSPGDEFSCNLNVAYDSAISTMKIPFTLSNGLTFVSFTPTSSIQLMSNPAEDHYIEFVTADPISSATLGSFSLKVNSNFSGSNVSLSTTVDSAYGPSPEYADIKNNISAGSITIPMNGSTNPTPSGIKSFSYSGGELTPAFSSSNYNYTFSLPSANVLNFGISAVPNNASDTITYVNADTNTTITNNNNITYSTQPGKSNMTIEIRVGSGDTATKYTITVTRPGSSTNPSSDPGTGSNDNPSSGSNDNPSSGSNDNPSGGSSGNTNSGSSSSGNTSGSNVVNNPTTGNAAIWGVIFVLFVSIGASTLIFFKKIYNK